MSNFRRAIEIRRRNILRKFGIPALPEPTQIDVEPTVRCNLRCPFCQHSFWRRSAPDMALDLFKKILDSFPSLERIKLQGIGEPLLHPGIASLITEAARRDIRTFLFSNGTAFSGETVDAIFSSGLGELSISCDHFDPDVLENLRPGLVFEEYRSGVRRALAVASSCGAQVQAWALLTKPLAGRLRDFLSFVRDLGFERLTFQTTLTSWGDSVAMGPFTVSGREIDECRASAGSVAPSGLAVEFAATNLFSRERPCPWPFYYSFISCDGFVQPCCIIADPHRLTFGNIRRKSFSAIWNSRPAYRLRKSITECTVGEMCKGCYRTSCGNG